MWLKKSWEWCGETSQYEIQILKINNISALEWKQDPFPNLSKCWFQGLALLPPPVPALTSAHRVRGPQPWELGLARSMKTSTSPDVSAPLQARRGARGPGTQPDHLSLGAAVNCCANEQGLKGGTHAHADLDTVPQYLVLSPNSLHSLQDAKVAESHRGHRQHTTLWADASNSKC